MRKASWRYVGPGIVVAATGVGAGDLVATLIAGSKFGYTLLWAAVIGCLVKIALAEATGRWHLSTGKTLFEGWRSLGRWTTYYFAVYVVVWGFVYGATAMSSSALPLNALFPDGPSIRVWAMLCGVLGLAFVWFNRYAVFEKFMTVVIGMKFLIVVYVAVRVTPDLGDALAGLVPTLPDGSLLYTLGLIGGVGGTITMAAYGYWVNAKGWTNSGWMKVMRLDNRVAYVTTGVFVVAMLIIGAELLHSADIALTTGDKGLVQLGDILEERFGAVTANLFLIGFFATSFGALVGVWQGVSLMFADFVERIRRERLGPAATPGLAAAEGAAPSPGPAPADAERASRPGAEAPGATAGAGPSADAADDSGSQPGNRSSDPATPTPTAARESMAEEVAAGKRERSLPFRAYLLWLTFPPMGLLFLDQPFGLVVVYGVLGAFFMPFLALTLLWLLNTTRTPAEWRNGILSNIMLTASGLLFLVLCVKQVIDLDW